MKINDHVTLLESSKGSFVYLIEGEEKALVDTGMPWLGKAILAELESLGVRPADIRHILLTHSDVDHIGNAGRLQRLSGAAVWAAEAEIPLITGEQPRPGFKKHLGKLFRFPKPDGIRAYGNTACGGAVRVIPAPGHSPGHVCLLYGDALFAGDLVQSHDGALRPYPGGWNWDAAMLQESVRQVSQLPFRVVCTSHGRPLPREAWDKMISAL